MPLETWLAFLGASALLLVLPGPTIPHRHQLFHHARPARRLPLVLAVALGDSTALFCRRSAWRAAVGLGLLVHRGQDRGRAVPAVPGLQAAARRRGAGHAAQAGEAGSRWKLFANTYLVTALNPQGHHLLRRLPAAVHRPGRRHGAPDVDPVGHLRDVRRPERRRLRAVRRPGAPPAGSPRAQRFQPGRRRAAVGRRRLGALLARRA